MMSLTKWHFEGLPRPRTFQLRIFIKRGKVQIPGLKGDPGGFEKFATLSASSFRIMSIHLNL